MELLIVLLVCGIIAIPVIAILALVRTGKLRDSFEERFAEQMDRMRDPEGKLSAMRRDLAQVQQQGTAQTELTAAPQPVEAAKPEPAAAPQPAPPVTATVSHAVPPLVAAFQTPALAQVVHALAKATIAEARLRAGQFNQAFAQRRIVTARATWGAGQRTQRV